MFDVLYTYFFCMIFYNVSYLILIIIFITDLYVYHTLCMLHCRIYFYSYLILYFLSIFIAHTVNIVYYNIHYMVKANIVVKAMDHSEVLGSIPSFRQLGIGFHFKIQMERRSQVKIAFPWHHINRNNELIREIGKPFGLLSIKPR